MKSCYRQTEGERRMNEKEFLIRAGELRLEFSYPEGRRQMRMDLADFPAWQARARRKLRELLRLDPRPHYGAPRAVRSMKRRGHKITALIMDAGDVELTAYLMEPDEERRSLPPVVAVQGHGRVAGVIGFEEDYHHGFGEALCRAGRTVLAVELRGFEALVDLAAGRPGARLDYGNWGKRMAFSLVTDAFQKGRTLIGDSVSDLLAWAQWLMGSSGFACYDAAGISYGGDCALCLAALDGRLRRAFISGSFGSFGPIFDTCYNLPAHCIPDVLDWLDRADIAALAAPRPVLMHFGEMDRPSPGNYSASYNDTVGPAFAELQRAYAACGAGAAEMCVSKGLEHEMDNGVLIEFLNRE